MTFHFTVPVQADQRTFELEPNTSIYFVGANGGGKTRLAVHIENQFGEKAHRISAQRALTLNPKVVKTSEKEARNVLKNGNINPNYGVAYRNGQRWGDKPAILMLNDFDALLQSLFAEQNNTALQTHNSVHADVKPIKQKTLFQKLTAMWHRILPHRILKITGDDIKTSISTNGDNYSASEMSDGERAIFYLIGQVLLADADTVLIFDEPELHIHQAIMSRLWDELEAARPDCGMIFISHDLDFVASRKGQKYVLRDYSPDQGWTIQDVPDDTGFPEDIVTLILGSRKPVLFVEGRDSSLDLAIYRACYPEWTIISRGSCEEVMHSVITMRRNASLTRVTCAGIVDADDHNAEDSENLKSKGVYILPVSEIENLFLLPDVVEAILASEGYVDAGLKSKITEIGQSVLDHATVEDNQHNALLRYVRRRIDRSLKILSFQEAKSICELADSYQTETNAVDVQALFKKAEGNIKKAIEAKDLPALLRHYDNKRLMEIACKTREMKVESFKQWIIRSMRNSSVPTLNTAIHKYLPEIEAA
jgi:AAA domain, putative AbiEii toxin, Type IV TA system/Protein of unknown function (DUF4435)